jgi:CubicO group peptidase (beta-lactamase class C family)
MRGLVPLVIVLFACGDATSPRPAPAPIDLSLPWRVAPAASQGIDSVKLATALVAARGVAGLRSLVVVRNAYLVAEYYAPPVTADSLNDVRSVTKSLMSMLVGIAIARGEIRGTDERLDRLIPAGVAPVTGAEVGITVDNLLTMTGGFEWNEDNGGNDYNNWALAPDQITFLLDRPVVTAPGTVFDYNSAAVHLLSVGIAVASGQRTRDYAMAHLLTPLGVKSIAWETDDRGYNNGGAGLSLTARDAAKLGLLVLQNGRSAAQAIVPAAWLARALAVHEAIGVRYGTVTGLNYGYLWWLPHVSGHPVWLAWGFRGQYIYIVPDQQLVIVATSALDAPMPADDEAIGVLDFISGDVAPAAGA